MRHQPTIPLFLWVATAIVAHAIFGGGATEVAEVLEERLDIRGFAHLVSQQARRGTEPVEITLAEIPPPPEELGPGAEDASTEESETQPDDPAELREDKLEKPEPEKEKPKEQERPPEVEKEKEQPQKKEQPAQEKPDTVQKPLQAQLDPRRTAVSQHVEDENQKDNPAARFAADQANHVEEETQARITANDGAVEKPSLSGQQAEPSSEPGNATNDRVGQSEEIQGQPDRSFGEGGDDADSSAGAQAATPAKMAQAASSPPPPASQPAAGQTAAEASQARQGNPETVSLDQGRFTMPLAQGARKAQQGRVALPGRTGSPEHLLGYGSTQRTSNGVNLNLSHTSAQAMIGADSISAMRKRAGEKRLSQHRGSFQNLGLEKWRPALENYVASVKPGNQTALNTARVPFASYLNQIHQRLHQVFADGFLASLEGLPPDHPLSNQEMSTNIEITLSREDGRIVRLGVTKSSGVTMFDVGALESVKKAEPYGIPPGAIVSADGNVYLHWEFHRRPNYACSTYFARPFILGGQQQPAPPRVEPPPRKDYDGKATDERSGSSEDPGKRQSQPG